jgi:RNA polymerase sigma factor (sigma-70 family)
VTARAAIVMPLTSTDVSTFQPAEQGVAALTTGLAAGNEEAFREFHAVYFDRLLRYILVVTRGEEEAARDALQETFTRVARHARRFDSEEIFWSWLTVLARSAALDGGRKRQRYWQTLTRYARSLFRAEISADPDEDFEEQLLAMVSRGLDGLSREDRDLVEGKYLRGESVRELASACGLTESAVESRLVRARRSLREKVLKGLKDEEAGQK